MEPLTEELMPDLWIKYLIEVLLFFISHITVNKKTNVATVLLLLITQYAL